MKRLFILAVSFVCICFASTLAKDSATPTQYQQLLKTVSGPELPTKAAELVKQAESKDRASTTIGATRAVVKLNPSATLNVVTAIAREAPEMAEMAAETASIEQPKEAIAIARTAAAAAPSKAGEIVFAVCRAVPGDFRSVAIIVAQTIPGSAQEVVKAVASAMPELKTGVERALADGSGNSISVAAVLDAAIANKVATQTGAVHFPLESTVSLPFIPCSETVKTIPPDTSGDVPTGGRENSRP